ncbi:MAG: hypothetical protein COB03_12635 [Alteromonas sp.]|nr:MAG: hypothetical protein COB03_12635 [Alteromonas sp.]
MVAPVIFAATPTELEFFEKKIRPVLVSECFKCHSNEANKVVGEDGRQDAKNWTQKIGHTLIFIKI